MKFFALLSLLTLQTWAQTPRLSDEAVIFRTDVGDMAVAFYPEKAPKHTEQILKLVRNGIYTHVLFFRIDKNYVAQIENFNARNPPLTPEQLAVVEKIPGEFNDIPHRRGILSMARFDDPNSAESSFSFVLGNAPNLDGKYTVFGEVIQNMSVLDEIERLPPKSVYIKSAEVVPLQEIMNMKLTAVGYGGPSAFTNPTVQIVVFTILALAAIAIFDKISTRKKSG